MMSVFLQLRFFATATAILNRAKSKSEDHFFLTKSEFAVFAELDLIVPVDNGGFIKAPSHTEGGIKLLWPDNDKYLVWAELEGYEFIMTPNISQIAGNELKQLNEKFINSNPGDFTPYPILTSVTVIDGTNTLINGFELPKFLVSCGRPQFIINKYWTMAAYDILEELNRSDLKLQVT